MTSEERQVQAVRRRLFEAAHAANIAHLCAITKLSRAVVTDALILCAGEFLPQVMVHALWLEWSRVMGFTGSSEYKTFPHYVRDKMREPRAEAASADRP